MVRTRVPLFALYVLWACGSSGDPIDSGSGPAPAPTTTTSSGADSGLPPADGGQTSDSGANGTDSDGDGLSDALEEKIATDYLPLVSVDASDKCPTRGILVRVSPHPTEAGRITVWAIVLYDEDCGANGHPGDDETFGFVVDPKKPAPDGVLAMRAISHQGTVCEHTTTCGRCDGMTPCDTTMGRQVVYPSKDKHGNYVDKDTCDSSFICDSGGCSLNPAAATPPHVNAGEPMKHLVDDLTKQGFITMANGWQQPTLMNYDPWMAGKFGEAGDVSKDLVDETFVIDTTKCQ